MALKSGLAGCPLCGQGAGRGDQAVREREGTNPVSCLRGSLEAAVPKGVEDGRAQSLTGRYWQSPGQAATGWKSWEGQAVATTSSIRLAHTRMHRAGN